MGLSETRAIVKIPSIALKKSLMLVIVQFSPPATIPKGDADGQSEIVMGQAIKKLGWKRNDIVVSTKLNWGGANGEVLVNNHGLSRKHIVEGLRSSLDRLQLEYVDIVYAHRPDRLTPARVRRGLHDNCDLFQYRIG